MNMRGYRIILRINSSTPFIEYTGIVTKTLVFTLAPELSSIRGLKGVLSPIAISPPFKIKNDHELGELVAPIKILKKNINSSIEPITLNGEYVFHIGGGERLVNHIIKKIGELQIPLAIKIGQTIVTYRIEKIVDITNEVKEKIESMHNRVRLYLKSPAQIFNVFTPTKLPKFSPTALELLIVPYALMQEMYTITEQVVVSAMPILGNLIETWYSLNTLKPVIIQFKEKKQIHLAGYVTYIVEPTNETIQNKIREILKATELTGIGRSRMNGFGTAVVKL